MRPPRGKRVNGMRAARAGLLTKIVILALLIVVAISLLELNSRVEQAAAERESLARQVAVQTQTNAGLTEAIENSSDPERIEEVARDRLGLVKQGEIVFYSMGD